MKSTTSRPILGFLGAGVVSLALAITSVISVLPSGPAFADERRGESRDDHRGGDRYGHRGGDYGRRHWHRYPIYVPPTVYYPEVVSPGISIVFPVRIH